MYFLRQKRPNPKDLGVQLVHLERCGEFLELYQVLWRMTNHLIVVVPLGQANQQDEDVK